MNDVCGEADGTHVLSAAQQAVWYDQSLDPEVPLYNIGVVLDLGNVDAARLEAAIRVVVERHDALRTVLIDRHGEGRQRILRGAQIATLPIAHVSIAATSDRDIEEYSRGVFRKRFDLCGSLLWEAQIISTGQGSVWWLQRYHHLVVDGVSVHRFSHEVAEAYNRMLSVGEPFTEVAPSYTECLLEEDAYRASPLFERDRAFWRGRLRQPLEGPGGGRISDQNEGAFYETGRAQFQLSGDLQRRMKEFCAQRRCSLLHFMLSLVGIYLARTGADADVTLGVPIHNRFTARRKRMIGMLASVAPVLVRTAGARSFDEVMYRVGAELRQCLRHQGALASELSGSRARDGQYRSYDVSVSLEPFEARARFGECAPRIVSVVRGLQRNKLSFYLGNSGVAGVGVEVSYRRQYFNCSEIERLGSRLEVLASAVLSGDPRIPEHLPLLSEAERRELLEVFNATQAPYPQERCVHELFEEQVARTPQAVAVRHEERSLTYAELNGRANQLAHYLRSRGVGAACGVLVGLCVERSVEMVVGLLGILKAGGAYIPLDPGYPAERLRYVLDDAAPGLVLTQESLRGSVAGTSAAVVELDTQWPLIAGHCAQDLPARQLGLTAAHLAYVIYTSGSTGRPKGVMVEHAQLVNVLSSMQREPGIRSSDCLLAVTTLSFDIAGLEIYLPLISGARVVLASHQAVADGRQLRELMERFGVTVLQGTPVTWRLLMSEGWAGRSQLKGLCGGEALSRDLARTVQARVGALWNLYGPTETTIWSCCSRVTGAAGREPMSESIGRPIANTQIYVLDRQRQPVPIGVTGEIYIGGAGVARGYLNRPELTAQRFMADPFSADPQARLYRSGDLGRWGADGTLEFVGRNDHQVKIRGFRIELGEIEAQLRAYPGVGEAVVVVREEAEGHKHLVAYYTGAGELSVPGLRAHLQSQLPQYMVPGVYVWLEQLPLTPNGKINRQGLPAPDATAAAAREYEAPQGSLEQGLAQIWQEVLKIGRVGRHDNFFELGGNSIVMLQLVCRLERAGFRTDLSTVFGNPSIHSLAERLVNPARRSSHASVVAIRTGDNLAPLFLIHDVSGEVLRYSSLAGLLEPDFPIYGLQTTESNMIGSPATLVQSLAAHHVEAIRTIQPYGPYRLAGWSFGGTVAYEMARQLLALGEPVEFLGLIDSYARIDSGEVPGLPGAEEDVLALVNYVRFLGVPFEDAKLRELESYPDLQRALAVCQNAGYVPTELSLSAVKSRLALARRLIQAANHYDPPPLAISMCYFAARDVRGESGSEDWKAVNGDTFQVKIIDGTHSSMMQPPHVQQLAAAVSDALEAAGSRR